MKNLIEIFYEKYRYLIFIALTGTLVVSTWLSNPIIDSNFLFHEGEYVGLLQYMRSFYNNEIKFPLLIHGAMDYIPSLLASNIYDDNHVIVGTRAINAILVWICWILFFDLCNSMISKKSNQRIAWMVFLLIIFFTITPRFNSFALLIQQSFLGSRDVFLILSVWCFTRLSDFMNPIRQRLFLIAGTFSAVIAFFWSYDRGIMALAFLLVIILAEIIKKEKINVLLLVITSIITLAIIQYANIVGSLIDNFDNVYYWIRNSKEVFGVKPSEADRMTLVVASMIIIFCIGSIFIAIKERLEWRSEFKYIIAGLILVQVLLLQTIFNRPGMPRLTWAIWPSILLMLFISSRKYKIDLPFKYIESKSSYDLSFLQKSYFLIFLLLIFFISPSFWSYGSFLKNIIIPKADSEIVSPEIMNLSRVIDKYGDRCVFGWVNEGVIPLISKKRFCTRYQYAIYVSKTEENKLLKQIIIESPAVVVFDVSGNSMANVDNRSMASRLPNVNKYILDNYKIRQNVGRYLIVSKTL